MSSSDETPTILPIDVHRRLKGRVESLTKDLRKRGRVKDKGTSIIDQAMIDQEKRDRLAKEDELRDIKKILENSLIVQPGKYLPLAVNPCFVILILRCGEGPTNQIQRLLYDPPKSRVIAGCSNGVVLRSDSLVGIAIINQPVGSTQNVTTVNGGEKQTVTIKRIQALEEVSLGKK